MTCQNAHDREKSGLTFGTLEPLCFLTDNLAPKESDRLAERASGQRKRCAVDRSKSTMREQCKV